MTTKSEIHPSVVVPRDLFLKAMSFLRGEVMFSQADIADLHNKLTKFARAHAPKQEPSKSVEQILQESIERVRPIVLAEREAENISGAVMNMILRGSECPCCYGKGKIPEEGPNATIAYFVGLERGKLIHAAEKEQP